MAKQRRSRAKASRASRAKAPSYRGAVGANIRAIREKYEPKMTQEDVANLFNPPVTRACIAQWEIGETVPGLDSIALLSKAFGVTIDSLVFGDSEPRRGALGHAAMELAKAWERLPQDRRELYGGLIMSEAKSKRSKQA